jgi:hypothetical protein
VKVCGRVTAGNVARLLFSVCSGVIVESIKKLTNGCGYKNAVWISLELADRIEQRMSERGLTKKVLVAQLGVSLMWLYDCLSARKRMSLIRFNALMMFLDLRE